MEKLAYGAGVLGCRNTRLFESSLEGCHFGCAANRELGLEEESSSPFRAEKTFCAAFCASPPQNFSRALGGLLNEIDHDARTAFAPCEVLSFFLSFHLFAGLKHMAGLYTN